MFPTSSSSWFRTASGTNFVPAWRRFRSTSPPCLYVPAGAAAHMVEAFRIRPPITCSATWRPAAANVDQSQWQKWKFGTETKFQTVKRNGLRGTEFRLRPEFPLLDERFRFLFSVVR